MRIRIPYLGTSDVHGKGDGNRPLYHPDGYMEVWGEWRGRGDFLLWQDACSSEGGGGETPQFCIERCILELPGRPKMFSLMDTNKLVDEICIDLCIN